MNKGVCALEHVVYELTPQKSTFVVGQRVRQRCAMTRMPEPQQIGPHWLLSNTYGLHALSDMHLEFISCLVLHLQQV